MSEQTNNLLQHTNVLPRIADRLTRDALARPGGLFKREFKRGAVCALMFDSKARELELTITRKGLSPENDFSTNGIARRVAWHSECETFARAFGVPEGTRAAPDAREMFYFAVYRWAVVRVAANGGE